MSTANLSELISTVRQGQYVMSVHYLTERVGAVDRPLPSTIIDGLAHDKPRIVRDDKGVGDPRGATCLVECETPTGNLIRVVLNYSRNPIKIVTAYNQGKVMH